MTRTIRGIALPFLLLASAAWAQPADLQEYYQDSGSGDHFYYSPGSVQADGSARDLVWTSDTLLRASNGSEKLMYHARIDCAAQTIVSQWVERFDAQSGASLGTVDLSGKSSPQGYSSGTMAGDLAGRVC